MSDPFERHAARTRGYAKHHGSSVPAPVSIEAELLAALRGIAAHHPHSDEAIMARAAIALAERRRATDGNQAAR